MFTIIVTGSRDYHYPEHNEYKIAKTLSMLNNTFEDIFIKVGDCPKGVDLLTRLWCKENLPESAWQEFKADWERYGRSAGPIRNHEMVDSGADLCIAWPLDTSRGTKDCAEYAHSKKIEVWFPDLPSWARWAVPIAG